MKQKDDMIMGFADKFPTIEVDTEYWKTLNGWKLKVQYLLRLLFQEKDLGNRLNMLNYIMTTIGKVGRAFIKNKDVREYFDVFENTTHLISISAAIGNLFKAKQTFRNTKNNAIAKMMGFPNGDHIKELPLELTGSMVESFLDMSDYHKKLYDITIDEIVTDTGKPLDSSDKKGSDDDGTSPVNKTIKLVGTYGKKDEDPTKDKSVRFGIIINAQGAVFDGEETTTISRGKLFYPASGMTTHPDEFRESIQHIFYQLYIEKVDTAKNYIRINGTKLDICERLHITEKVVNIDIDTMTRAIRRTLDEGKRRGWVLVGEPGTGKTISVHKIMQSFRDKLIFWVSPDSINSTSGIRRVFKFFKMFEGCIIIFDDIDSAPLTAKDEISNEFLAKLDGTNKLSGAIIATVNDPSKIHMAIINRPERFDDIVLAKKPQTISEISDIIFSKADTFGYVKKTGELTKSYQKAKGVIKLNPTTKSFKDLCKSILLRGFTQVQVAGLIADCNIYTEDGDITLPLLKTMISRRIESIECANMKAIKGRLEVDMNEISDEAKAGLSRKH